MAMTTGPLFLSEAIADGDFFIAYSAVLALLEAGWCTNCGVASVVSVFGV